MVVERIRQLLESKDLSPTQFADLIGVGRPVVSHIMSERNKPSLEVVQRISDAFPDISLSWLLKGIGSMLEVPEAPTPMVTGNDLAPVAAPPPAPIVASAIPARPETVQAAAMPSEMPLLATPTAATAPVPPPATAAVATPSIPVPVPSQSFRASRFVPGQVTAPTPPLPAEPQVVVPPLQSPSSTLKPPLESAPPAPALVAPAASLPPASASVEAALPAFFAEPGKAIRRIVIFYRDGSFADYQPEQY